MLPSYIDRPHHYLAWLKGYASALRLFARMRMGLAKLIPPPPGN